MANLGRAAKAAAIVIGYGLTYLVGGAIALWLAWLALTAFVWYGYQAIVWVLP